MGEIGQFSGKKEKEEKGGLLGGFCVGIFMGHLLGVGFLSCFWLCRYVRGVGWSGISVGCICVGRGRR